MALGFVSAQAEPVGQSKQSAQDDCYKMLLSIGFEMLLPCFASASILARYPANVCETRL